MKHTIKVIMPYNAELELVKQVDRNCPPTEAYILQDNKTITYASDLEKQAEHFKHRYYNVLKGLQYWEAKYKNEIAK